jgi:hypothetical protein
MLGPAGGQGDGFGTNLGWGKSGAR